MEAEMNFIKAAREFEREIKPLKISKQDKEFIKLACEIKGKMNWLNPDEIVPPLKTGHLIGSGG